MALIEQLMCNNTDEFFSFEEQRDFIQYICYLEDQVRERDWTAVKENELRIGTAKLRNSIVSEISARMKVCAFQNSIQ